MGGGSVLSETPGMGGLLFKAALKKGRKLAVGDEVPRLEAGLRGVRFLPEQLSRYGKIVGAPESEFMPLVAPHILAAPLHLYLLTQPESPLQAMGLIHVRNSVNVVQPVPKGEALDVHVVIGDTTWVHKGLEVDVRTEVHAAGELVWEESSVVYSRQSVAADIPRKEKSDEMTDWGDEGEQWSLGGNLGRKYASVSGDWNPIHLYGWTAKLFGFSRPIIHGMWSFARCMSLFPVSSGELSVEFKRPVTLPGRPRLVRKLSDEGETRFALIRDKDGKPFLAGVYTPSKEVG